MSRHVIAVSLTAVMLIVVFASGTSWAEGLPGIATSSFSDVPGDHPNARDFALLQILGIFEGYGDGTVRPDRPLWRSEFAKVAVTLLNKQDQVEAVNARDHPDFRDGDQIAPEWWGWINVAHSLGLLRGYEDNTFRPRANITLAEVTTVLLRATGYEDFLDDLSYPHGYVAMAERLGLTRGVDLAPYLPVTRAEMAAMAVNALELNPPDSTGSPADDRLSGYRPSLLDRRDERIAGLVSAVSEDGLKIDGKIYPLGPSIYLFDVDQLQALPGQWVSAYKRPTGEVGYIETAAAPTEFSGVLGDIDAVNMRLLVEGRWMKWIPEDADLEQTRWVINGRMLSQADALRKLSAAADAVEVRVSAREEWAEEIEALVWDVPEVTVAGEAEETPGGWLLPIEYMSPRREVIRREILFGFQVLPVALDGDGEIARVDDLQKGDVIRAATGGAFGMASDDPVSASRLYRIQARRNVVSGTVEQVSVLHEEGDLLFIFELEDGTEVRLRRGGFLGAEFDMSLNDLYHASWVTFALGFDGYARRALEARVEGTKSKYVKLLTVEHVTEDGYIRESLLVVDEAGEAVAYQLAFPALWALFVDDSLELRRDRLVQIEVNDAGRCEDVLSWVEEEPLSGTFVVVFVDAAESFVMVRRTSASVLHSSSDQPDSGEDVLVAVDAAVYTSDGKYVGVESLKIGQKVWIYRDDAGDVAHIEVEGP